LAWVAGCILRLTRSVRHYHYAKLSCDTLTNISLVINFYINLILIVSETVYFVSGGT